ncbi:hypothetical protein HMPREF9241_01633 [Schaalia turicensis ACS-279-V-Col4]|uniref:Helix-turn-helix domain-containing protein n=1 Tax=Schaalia turicensis ACS-279-V-Col4 TaxID=883077 RepID=K0YNS3_9ACTO|nr:helix-turn-helix domain-containing protein [Schaalia turicensis]EJZ85053.1 hypothetical protein HMPREF9241_01633 [Schaalia turicensis ACS-279-V-Col4]
MSTPTTTSTLVTPAALTAEEAATYLGLSRQTLANWRVRGLGPAYSRLGGVGRPRIVYLVEDLDAFLRATRVETTGGQR